MVTAGNLALKGQLGAGEGNRTLVVSLEGFCSATELHPPSNSTDTSAFQYALPQITLVASTVPASPRTLIKYQFTQIDSRWWRRLDSNQRRHSQRVYSPSPLTTRALLLDQQISICVTGMLRARRLARTRSPSYIRGFMISNLVYVNRKSMYFCEKSSGAVNLVGSRSPAYKRSHDQKQDSPSLSARP